MSQRILKLCVASLLNILCFPAAGVTKAKRAKDHVDEGLEKVRSKRWPLGKVLQVSCKIVGAVALNCSNNLTTRSWGKHHRRSSIFWCHPSQPGTDLGDRSSHRRIKTEFGEVKALLVRNYKHVVDSSDHYQIIKTKQISVNNTIFQGRQQQ